MVAALVTGVIMRFAPSGWITLGDRGHPRARRAVLRDRDSGRACTSLFALSRPDQLISMFNGRIPRAWAKSHAAAWLSEVEASESVPPSLIARELAAQAASETTTTTSTPWRSIKAKPPPGP